MLFLAELYKAQKIPHDMRDKQPWKTETQFHDLIMTPDLFLLGSFLLSFPTCILFIFFCALRYMKTTPHVDTSPSYPRYKYRMFQDIVLLQ